jgi:hypothetical protein
MQLTMTPQQQRDYLASNQPVVQAKVDEPVLAWSIFVRAGSYGAMAAGYVSPVVAALINLIAKKRAAGLPSRFLLVVTPTKVRAFKFSQKRSGLRVGDELAVWDRAQLSVSTKETALTTRVTLACAADGEQVICDTGKGEFTDAFLRTIGATPAAVSNHQLRFEAA